MQTEDEAEVEKAVKHRPEKEAHDGLHEQVDTSLMITTPYMCQTALLALLALSCCFTCASSPQQ